MAKAETTLALFPDATPTTDNKATATTSSDVPYTGYDNVYDDYCIVVIGLSKNDKPCKPVEPDFEPHDFNIKTTHNRANGNGGALQAMHSRAALFAKNPRIVEAFVRRARDGQMWKVDAGGYITKINHKKLEDEVYD